MPLPHLVSHNNEWEQRQMACAFDFARQLSLAAGAVSGLTARFNFTCFADKTAKGIDVFIVETFAGRAIAGIAETSSARATIASAIMPVATIPTIAPVAIIIIPPWAGDWFIIQQVSHRSVLQVLQMFMPCAIGVIR
jgi:hypothetical protein